jgi:hypothetical protein
MAKLTERRLEHQEPEILTPAQMKACLEAAARERKLLAYLALGGFAGLRTEEILRQRWEDIAWPAGEVYVRQPKRLAAWRPRRVEILPALRKNLEPLAAKEGKVLPGGQRTLYLLRRTLMNKLGWKTWPRNPLRHSFKSYHLAFWQDRGKLAEQMGHSMTGYSYDSPQIRASAEAWLKPVTKRHNATCETEFNDVKQFGDKPVPVKLLKLRLPANWRDLRARELFDLTKPLHDQVYDLNAIPGWREIAEQAEAYKQSLPEFRFPELLQLDEAAHHSFFVNGVRMPLPENWEKYGRTRSSNGKPAATALSKLCKSSRLRSRRKTSASVSWSRPIAGNARKPCGLFAITLM